MFKELFAMRKCWLAALLMVWLGLAGQALAADAEIRIYLVAGGFRGAGG